MRFIPPKLNEQRTRSHFAWLPITIKGEIRWLERVTYIEEWYATEIGYFGDPLSFAWHKIKFIDNE